MRQLRQLERQAARRPELLRVLTGASLQVVKGRGEEKKGPPTLQEGDRRARFRVCAHSPSSLQHRMLPYASRLDAHRIAALAAAVPALRVLPPCVLTEALARSETIHVAAGAALLPDASAQPSLQV